MAGLQLHNVTTCHTNSIKALENHTYILTPALQNCICKNKNYQLKATWQKADRWREKSEKNIQGLPLHACYKNYSNKF